MSKSPPGPWSLSAASAVLAAALATLSCGGAREDRGPTEPVAAPAASADETGGLTTAARETTLVCHYEEETGAVYDLEIPTRAVKGHAGHGDVEGSCADACPCFSVDDIAALQGRCSEPIKGTCFEPYSLGVSCLVGSGAGNLGYFEAAIGSGHCVREIWNPRSGGFDTIQKPVTAAQHAACRDVLVGSAIYPAYCPQ